jgi:hypothetical protein
VSAVLSLRVLLHGVSGFASLFILISIMINWTINSRALIKMPGLLVTCYEILSKDYY